MKIWGSLPHQYMNEAARRYGDVVGLLSGRIPLVLISGLENIKDVSLRECFSGRPISLIQKEYDKGSYGMMNIQGEKWKEQRKFTLRHLKEFGFGKSSLEGIAYEEIQAVFTEMERISGGYKYNWANPVPVHNLLGYAGINVLWHIMAGQRYNLTDPTLKKLLNNIKRLTIITEPGGGAATAFPIITKMIPQLSTLREFLELRETIFDFIKKEIRGHWDTLDSESPRDFIDMYIREIDKQKGDDQTTFDDVVAVSIKTNAFSVTDKQLAALCVDLFMAGADTTFNSMTFSLLYMILYPEAQKKVQEELDRVVGKDRMPSLEDRFSLPYIGATLDEVMRKSSVAPLALPHAVLYSLKEAEFKGYIIPKFFSRVSTNSPVFSHVIAQEASNHYDKANYTNHTSKHPTSVIIFFETAVLFPEEWTQRTQGSKVGGAMDEGRPGYRCLQCLQEKLRAQGKRQCIGEALARNNIFLFFSCLMQRYTMEIPPGHPKPTEEPLGGLTLVPKPFEIDLLCLALLQFTFAFSLWFSIVDLLSSSNAAEGSASGSND
ncbi:hypothetical protein J437_LFUL001493 [Ladona fulva]|uniref:Cytochrome P450 n=1 Tax=Ladona fulva TaxID=123851 RepID=A0A8K0NVY6_LADFU|nr:hypothetical protein J437_LFUL001493 [Ladona fulva]